MTVIGVTGGIGSGKSTVCQIMAASGAAVIDADQISRDLTAAGGLAMPQVAMEFGEAMVLDDGSMNRAAMRDLVFQDPAAKARLEHIIHPLISSISAQREAAAKAAQLPLIVHDVPLLVESFGNWRERLDEIWVVDCSEATQIARVQARSQLPREAILRILAAQATREQRLAAADVVLLNEDKTLEELTSMVKQAIGRFGLS
ncbi:dephospho-CoA kinase [Comamonas serinivorans]|uniref:Dephospho-CoA kinase n=1 Tax=Comamonas serinivorans TaxID=1082851 RepID=A0A1Y0EQK1_9BURK|nr:dephospho-CoA kinase [Comamonas serinivorans]ARU05937.1 dephospho-CoA kinase [Comamonas serinivorans]